MTQIRSPRAGAAATLAAVALAMMAPSGAHAERTVARCALGPHHQLLSVDDLKTRARQAGYIWIDSAEVEDDACVELHAYNPRNGASVSLRYDPSTGRLVEVE
jgi:Peptidase propeptide and YPEB domain